MNKRQWKKKYEKERYKRYKKVLEVGEVIYNDEKLREEFCNALATVLARQIRKTIIY